MIIDFFIGMLIALVDILPTFNLDLSNYSGALNTFLNALATINYYLPIKETFSILSLILSFYGFRLLYRIIINLLERIVI